MSDPQQPLLALANWLVLCYTKYWTQRLYTVSKQGFPSVQSTAVLICSLLAVY